MSHTNWTWGNWVDSWLLVVGSQIANLTFGLSFGHNLCFLCPNGSCEPIFDIYVLIALQWYKKLFESMGFDPCNFSLKIWESIWDSNSHNGSSLGSVRVHSLTLFYTLGSMRCDSRASFLARNLASHCFGRKPKARVATSSMNMYGFNLLMLTSIKSGSNLSIVTSRTILLGKQISYVV
jgi:acyl-CoA synthetase (AMP-forming)/AMP-acid ligase II